MRLLCLFLIILLSSCSFISEEEGSTDDTVRPDIVLIGAEYTLGQAGENPIFIKSPRMTFYSSDNRAVTEALSFVQYDDDGNIIIEGQADSSDINTDTKVIDLSGSVMLRKVDDDMFIQADSLVFDSGNSMITADGSVYVQTGDGIFSGTGFAGDLKMDIYSFQSIDEGVFNL